MATPGDRIRGHVARRLVRELAEGKLSQRELADKHGFSPQAISEFKSRNAERIAEVAANLDDQFAGLWIADKGNRIAEYMDDVERVNKKLDRRVSGEMLRVKANALRSVAEELGLKSTVDVRQTKYVIKGVDPDEDLT